MNKKDSWPKDDMKNDMIDKNSSIKQRLKSKAKCSKQLWKILGKC